MKTIIPDEAIIDKIYLIRGYKVMLDRDLSELYGVETKRLNEQVRRNSERFPEHFMFRLTDEEYEVVSSRSQFATLKRGENSKYLPYAFTEHGVLMLSNVLKSGRAIEMSIKIIDVFVRLREMILTHKDILLKLEQIEKKVIAQDEDIQVLFTALKQLISPPREPMAPIGFRT